MRVDFYILKGDNSRELTACKLCEKAFMQGHQVYIHVDSAAQAQQLDDLLWTFRDGSFLPHEILKPSSSTAAAPMQPAVCIAWQDTPGIEHYGNYNVLLNLASTVPGFYTHFERIADIVNQSEPIRSQGRQRFSFYRQQNCDLQHHEL